MTQRTAKRSFSTDGSARPSDRLSREDSTDVSGAAGRRRFVRFLLAARREPLDSLKFALLGSLVLLLYADAIPAMVADWWTDPGYSHGFLVLPLAAYVLWTQRDSILAARTAPDNRGLVLTALSCFFYLAGSLGAEFFVTRVSLLLLVAGITWTFWGIGRLRRLAFPLLLLVTAIPLPAIVYHQVALPLQILASGTSTSILQFFGIPVFREGNVIHLAEVQLGIEEACSGLRSVSSLAVLALVIGYLHGHTRKTRVALFLMVLPVAIVTNFFRVAGTAVLAEHYDVTIAMGFYHSFTGWLVFLAGFGFLYVAAKSLAFVFERGQVRAETVGSR